MRKTLLATLCLIVFSAHAQVRVGAPPPPTDFAKLGDEFDDPGSLASWKRFDATYGWPDFVKKVAIADGVLHLEPLHSAWVRDRIAPFFYREVTGDFDVRARVKVHGANGDIPGGTWSLGGLLARVPNRNTEQAWEPRRENWHFITTGVGHVRGEQMTETKGTYNSYSSLKLRPFPSGWVELRLVKVGMSLVALARADGEKAWKVRDRFYRMEMNPVMQVGLIAYTTSDEVVENGPEDPTVLNRTVHKDAKVDMQMEVDWFRIAAPKVAATRDWYAQVSGGELADPNVSEAKILELVGE